MDFKEFLKYTIKADEIIISAFKELAFSIPEANTLFSHILSAQHIWVMRILGQKSNYAVWEELNPQDFEKIHEENVGNFQHILSNRRLDDIIHYSNAMGSYSNTIGEILLHICNHGTYHRGQLAKLLKQANYEPPITDYIILKREGMV